MSRTSFLALVVPAVLAGATATAAAQAAEPKPLSTPTGPLASYYSGFTLQQLYDLIVKTARNDIYEQAKTTLGRDPLWKSANPDPVWILQWKQTDWTNASDNAESIVQAAFNRSWEHACVKEFDAGRAAHDKIAASLAPELARVDGLTNYYERIAGYGALAAKLEADTTAAGLPMERDPAGPIGLRVTILAHAIAFHQQSSHGWLDFPGARFPHADTLRRDGGRERTSDVAFERSAYCARVASRGGFQTTEFARIWDPMHASSKRVAWPTVWGDEKAVRKKAAELVSAAAPTLVAAEVKLDRKPEYFSRYTVTGVKGDEIAVKRLDINWYDYACKRTRRIERIESDGRVIYEQKCKSGKSESTTVGALTFAELPPGVTLAAGDELDFHADITASKDKPGKNTAALKTSTRTLTLTGRHLSEVTRAGQKLTW